MKFQSFKIEGSIAEFVGGGIPSLLVRQIGRAENLHPSLDVLRLANFWSFETLKLREGRPHPQARPSQCEPARRRADGFPGTVCASFHAPAPHLYCVVDAEA